ncbi:hypothetical protein Q9295_09475 [Xinfangfangia sp. CPCC 101601]|uniref:Uncharacterized protein n=1 Tax=Pseudogemmobacter lacusdianii TaxID=3069608 RepID=A0ABU0VXW9_9RHOB|nr:hypothetical protein [Xinfangfangia sp. CPCC 101601]MDQ2066604.1 hypothetical protein [Xinfangfangia sp. CPCC 101601]
MSKAIFPPLAPQQRQAHPARAGALRARKRLWSGSLPMVEWMVICGVGVMLLMT